MPRRKKITRNLWLPIIINLLALFVFLIILCFYYIFFAPHKIKVLSSSVTREKPVSPMQSNITFSFNTWVDKNLVERTFKISPQVLGNATWQNNRTLTFQLDEHLKENATYEIKFEMRGVPLPFFPTTTPEVFNLQFKTGKAPKIVSTSPQDRTENVPLNKYLIFEFNQKIAPADFKNYFVIRPKTEGKISAKNHQLIFAPEQQLQKNTRYLAGVLKGMPGENAQQLTQDYFINFQTAGEMEFQNVRLARIPILMYHNVGLWGQNESFLSQRFKIQPENLEKHLQYISENYNVVTLADVYDNLTNGLELPENPLVLTFDDGWRGVYTEAFPLLQKYDLHFTLFLITSHYEAAPGYLTKKQIQEMIDSGLADIGNHTVHHPMLGFFGKDYIKKEIKDASDKLKSDFGVEVKTFSYPGGSYNKNVLEVLEELGFHTAVTVTAGMTQKENELLLLRRIGIDGGDTVDMLQQKLEVE